MLYSLKLRDLPISREPLKSLQRLEIYRLALYSNIDKTLNNKNGLATCIGTVPRREKCGPAAAIPGTQPAAAGTVLCN